MVEANSVVCYPHQLTTTSRGFAAYEGTYRLSVDQCACSSDDSDRSSINIRSVVFIYRRIMLRRQIFTSQLHGIRHSR
jgi:hypothetical protein